MVSLPLNKCPASSDLSRANSLEDHLSGGQIHETTGERALHDGPDVLRGTDRPDIKHSIDISCNILSVLCCLLSLPLPSFYASHSTPSTKEKTKKKHRFFSTVLVPRQSFRRLVKHLRHLQSQFPQLPPLPSSLESLKQLTGADNHRFAVRLSGGHFGVGR